MKSKKVFKHLAKGYQVQYRLKNGDKTWHFANLLTVYEINTKKRKGIKIEFREYDHDKINFEKEYVNLFGDTEFPAKYDEFFNRKFSIWKYGTEQKFPTYDKDEKTTFKTNLSIYPEMTLDVTRKIIESFTRAFGLYSVFHEDKVYFKCNNFNYTCGKNSTAYFENKQTGRRLEFRDDENSREFMIYIQAVFQVRNFK